MSRPMGPALHRSAFGGTGISWSSLWLGLKRLLLLGGALCGFFLFLVGVAFAIVLLLPHFLAPTTAYCTRQLYFDYSLPAAVAEVSLLPESEASAKVRPS